MLRKTLVMSAALMFPQQFVVDPQPKVMVSTGIIN